MESGIVLAVLGVIGIYALSGKNRYPECFEICPASKNIYNILKKFNLLEKYANIIDLHQYVLCLEIASRKECSHEKIKENIVYLMNTYGPPMNDPKELANILIKHIAVDLQNPTPIITLLLLIADYLQREIEDLKQSSILKETDLQNFETNMETFYDVHFNELIKLCS